MESPKVVTLANVVPKNNEGKFKASAVCFVLGVGCLVSWNSVLMIEDYYQALFPSKKYHPSRVLTILYQPFALVTTSLLVLYESKLNTRLRNIAGYIIFAASSFMLVVLDLATKGAGGVGPFACICAIVTCFGIALALVQGGIVGDLSFTCNEFIQSFVAGLAASGALTSALRLSTKALFDKTDNGLRKGALLFLSISALVELLCVFLYAFYFPKLPIVKYFRVKAASEGSKTVASDLAAAGVHNPVDQVDENDPIPFERLSTRQLFHQNMDYCFDLFMILALTLSIVPGFIYENTGKHKLGDWYAPVLVTSYSIWDFIASYVPLINYMKLESRKGLMIATLLRILLVPVFYFTAKYADQGWMIFLVSFLGFTNGHLTACILTDAPKGYKGPEANALGNVLTIFIVVGTFAGVSLDWLWLIGKKDAF